MFENWDNYFLLMGTAAASLIGLLFVVATLTDGFERSAAIRGAQLYVTPTVAAFSVVLWISATALAPGLAAPVEAVLCGVAVLFGLTQAITACVGILGPPLGTEPPRWSDFWLYGVAPAALYVGLLIAAAALWAEAEWAAYPIAALLLLLLLAGIRNAWDLITWMAPRRSTEAR